MPPGSLPYFAMFIPCCIPCRPEDGIGAEPGCNLGEIDDWDGVSFLLLKVPVSSDVWTHVRLPVDTV